MANDLDMEKFIEAVRSRPPLWDKHNPMYRKLDLTHGLWNAIIEEMGGSLTVTELKQKWYSLRDCFRRELRIAKAGRKKKKWIYYNQMLFLLSTKYNSKKSVKNNNREITMSDGIPFPVKIEAPDETEPDLNNTDSDHSDFNENENINYENVIQDVFSQGHGQTETVDDLTVTPDVQETGEHSRFCKIESENEESKIRTTQAAGEFSGHCRVPADNDDYHFAMSIIPYMRQVPMHKKLRMRIKIFKIIAEESGFDDTS